MLKAITIALTLFGEASGESTEGKRAVASVIWTRALLTRARGDTNRLVAVCLAPKQFSCWNDGRRPRVPGDYPSRAAWAECKAIADEMCAGTFKPTITATHYYSGKKAPYWVASMTLVREIGGHRFYVETEGAK